MRGRVASISIVWCVLGVACLGATQARSPLDRLAGKWTMAYVMYGVTLSSSGVYSEGFTRGSQPAALAPAGGTLSYDIKHIEDGQLKDHWTVTLREVSSSKYVVSLVSHGKAKDFTLIDKLPLIYSDTAGFQSGDETEADGTKTQGSIVLDAKAHTWKLGRSTITFTKP